jgi:hypothetical protein
LRSQNPAPEKFLGPITFIDFGFLERIVEGNPIGTTDVKGCLESEDGQEVGPSADNKKRLVPRYARRAE